MTAALHFNRPVHRAHDSQRRLASHFTKDFRIGFPTTSGNVVHLFLVVLFRGGTLCGSSIIEID